jgi:ADP-ribose pyrophosphatase YjhB (NUDIX family)
MKKQCDHMSVGVVIKNSNGDMVLIERAFFPPGFAPPAGHVDDHGSPEQAAVDEVREETGLHVSASDLQKTAIAGRRMDTNKCSRPGGDYHVWTVYEVTKFTGDIQADPTETKGAGWYSPTQVQALADQTKDLRAGKIVADDWDADPGIEDIWLGFLTELGYVR